MARACGAFDFTRSVSLSFAGGFPVVGVGSSRSCPAGWVSFVDLTSYSGTADELGCRISRVVSLAWPASLWM